MIPPDPRYLIAADQHEAERAEFGDWLKRSRPRSLSALPADHPFFRCALASGAMRSQAVMPVRRRVWPWLLAIAGAALLVRAVL